MALSAQDVGNEGLAALDLGSDISPADLQELSGEDAGTLWHLLPHLMQKRADARFDDDLERLVEALRVRADAVAA